MPEPLPNGTRDVPGNQNKYYKSNIGLGADLGLNNGKNGLFRNNLSGKRVDFSARTVIGPDVTLKANEIAIPVSFSKKLTFPERVCSFNFQYLDDLIQQNKVNYVIRDNGSKIYDINIYKKPKIFFMKKGFILEKGDIIIRNNKKIDPEKYKQIKGIDIQLENTDSIVRNGKLLKNIKNIDENIPLNLNNDDRILRNGVILNPNFDDFILFFSLFQLTHLKDQSALDPHVRKEVDFLIFYKTAIQHRE